MSAKLTKDLREKIRDKLLTHRFNKDIEKHYKKCAKFSEKVYNNVFDKKERDLIATVPAKWLRTDNDMKVQFGTDYANIAFNGNF